MWVKYINQARYLRAVRLKTRFFNKLEYMIVLQGDEGMSYHLKFDSDVIIIGAGFAGITAGRELTNLGHSAIILEARNRIGGRTWFGLSPLGQELELGGTWVHWVQPHIWSEIIRYNLPLTRSPQPEKAIWYNKEQAKEMSPDALFNILNEGLSIMDKEAIKVFPNPHQFDCNHKDIQNIEDISLTDKINLLNLDEQHREKLKAMMALNFHGNPDNAAYSQYLRWTALCGGNWSFLFEACATYKLKNGTLSLLKAIQSESRAKIHLEAIVESITEDEYGVLVITQDGKEYRSKQLICTVPLNTLTNIKFSPALDPVLTSVSQTRHAAEGIKIWIRIKGYIENIVGLANADCPLNFTQVEYTIDGDTLLVAFGPSADINRINIKSPKAIEKILQQWLPKVEVINIDCHDWAHDSFSLGTWAMLRPNQLKTIQKTAQQSLGNRIHFCGSDFAQGWAGFMDGAIESAKTISYRVNERLYEVNETIINNKVPILST